MLRALLGKVEKDYTEESWTALQDAIDMAEEAKLKSEYDLIKDELTVNSLILAEKGPLEGFIEMMDDMGSFALILIAIIIVLAIIVEQHHHAHTSNGYDHHGNKLRGVCAVGSGGQFDKYIVHVHRHYAEHKRDAARDCARHDVG